MNDTTTGDDFENMLLLENKFFEEKFLIRFTQLQKVLVVNKHGKNRLISSENCWILNRKAWLVLPYLNRVFLGKKFKKFGMKSTSLQLLLGVGNRNLIRKKRPLLKCKIWDSNVIFWSCKNIKNNNSSRKMCLFTFTLKLSLCLWVK